MDSLTLEVVLGWPYFNLSDICTKEWACQ